MRRRILWLGLGALLLAAAIIVPTLDAAPAPAPRAMTDSPQSMESMSADMGEEVGPEACALCHEDRVNAFAGNPHTALDQPGWSEHGGSCASCHRGAAEHIEQGGGEGTIFAFGENESVLDRTAVCQDCHADTHPRFLASKHAAAGLTCTSCHTIHGADIPDLDEPDHLLQTPATTAAWHGGPFDELDDTSATCAGCHGTVLADFRQNEHHRLEEGILTCASCHDPHAPQPRLALGGFDQTGCGDCHGDKTGPFIFEHGASKVEGCTACHTPHGSTNRHMLTFQNQGELCFSCHAEVPAFHVAGAPGALRFDTETNCTNCHSSIHGSNFDPFFLK